MLRWIVGVPRRSDETWVEFVQRATHRSEELAAAHGATDWVVLQKTRKWKLASKAATSTDRRWITRMLNWKPWFRVLPFRSVGRPVERWGDDLTRLAGGDWPQVTLNGPLWNELGVAYISSSA